MAKDQRRRLNSSHKQLMEGNPKAHIISGIKDRARFQGDLDVFVNSHAPATCIEADFGTVAKA